VLRAVIFDFDGVITDSEVLHLRAFNEVLRSYGVEMTTKSYYQSYLGLSDADCFKVLIQQGILKVDPAEIDQLAAKKKIAFAELAQHQGRIIEGVHNFVEMLNAHQVPMAICSGALLCEIELILEEAKLRKFFEVIVSAEQVKKGKPDPEGFLLTLEKLNATRPDPILAEQCVVVEDSHWGLEAARVAGMHTVAVTNSYDADQLRLAELIVGNLAELDMQQLQRLCA